MSFIIYDPKSLAVTGAKATIEYWSGDSNTASTLHINTQDDAKKLMAKLEEQAKFGMTTADADQKMIKVSGVYNLTNEKDGSGIILSETDGMKFFKFSFDVSTLGLPKAGAIKCEGVMADEVLIISRASTMWDGPVSETSPEAPAHP